MATFVRAANQFSSLLKEKNKYDTDIRTILTYTLVTCDQAPKNAQRARQCERPTSIEIINNTRGGIERQKFGNVLMRGKFRSQMYATQQVGFT